MTAYIIFLLVVLLLSWGITKNYCGYKMLYWILLVLALILFEGLRDMSVGTDTGGYSRSFMYGRGWMGKNYDFSNLKFLLDEPLFALVNRVGLLFSSNYVGLLITTALIHTICVMYSIKENSMNVIASLFTFITLSFYLFGFAAIRQSIALCVYMLSFKYLYSRQFLKYCGVVIIAALCHKSVIVAIPVYFIANLQFSKKTIAIISLSGVIIGMLMPYLLEIGSSVEDRYAYYLKNVRGGEMLMLFAVCLAAFFIYARKNISEDNLTRYDVNLNMVIVSAVIYVTVFLTKSNTELNRFAMFFQVPSIFLYADYYHSIYKEKYGSNIPFVVLTIVFISYYLVYVYKIGGITNYKLNTTIF